MGEIFGFSSGASARWTLRRRPRQAGHYREEGWGVAVLEGPAAMSLKQARGSPDESMASVLASGRLEGEVGLAYIRRWTHSPRLANCHPFVRELGGREWAFAHNGRVEGLRGDAKLRPTAFQPVGSTDSEHAFCVLLSAIADRGEGPPAAHREVLRRVSDEISRYGAFNYVLATDRCLFAYSSGEYGLHLWERPAAAPAEGAVALADEDWEMRLEIGDPGRLVVAATNRMGPEPGWRSIRPHELALAADGRMEP